MAKWTACTEALGFISLHTFLLSVVLENDSWEAHKVLSYVSGFFALEKIHLLSVFQVVFFFFFVIVVMTVYCNSYQHSRFSTAVLVHV